MCYHTRSKELDDLEKEAHRITEIRLMEEARHRHEDHQRRRREREENKPLAEKVKEVVGVR